jgi:flavin-dependent dehydrogenase
MPEDVKSCEVLVVGGGPAGATAAALLAQQGRRVVLLEKARHPRFHIGESLLPLNLPLFDRLGVREEVEAVGLRKYGVEFNSPTHGAPVTLDFADAWDKGFPYAFQVRRSEFDHILIRNAARQGAEVLEGTRVTRVDFDDGDRGARVTATGPDGGTQRWQARFVIDASGRDTLLANQFGWKQKNRRHNSAAVYGHFTGARRLAGRDEGNISIFWFDHGWFWFIPLADGTTSVGAVCWPYYLKSRRTDVTRFFHDTIALCPELARRLEGAQLVEPATATGNYSYAARRTSGHNYLMLGDAFAFIDPVFSSGVFLAMNSAFEGAEAVAACLDRPQAAPAALRRFDAVTKRGPDLFSWFIYRVTNPAMRELFMHPRNDWRVKEALLGVLAGDIFRGTPFRGRLQVFKALYLWNCALAPRRSLAAWLRRRRIVRETLHESAAH